MIDEAMKLLRRAKTANGMDREFKKCLSCIKELKVNSENRRGEVDFSRIPGRGKDGELPFRNRLHWLRTIPLEKDTSFHVLHAETGVYRKDRKGRYSADLLGLWRSGSTTQFAIAELKYGPKGDHLLYAIIEGLRNIHLQYQGIKDRLEKCWKITNDLDENAWGKTNPFSQLSFKNMSLVIIGDDSWIKQQEKYLKYIKKYLAGNKVIVDVKPEIKISVYSSRVGAKSDSKPYAILPMKKYL